MKETELYPKRQGRPHTPSVAGIDNTGYGAHSWSTRVVVDDEPVNGATTIPISSNWAYDYIKEQEEKDELNNLLTNYNSMMANERYTSDRRGYEIR